MADVAEKLCEELEAAVVKHQRYLEGLESAEFHNPSAWCRLAKRSTDILLSTLGLAVLLPTFLLLSVLVRRDSRGPVFFRQERLGKDGRQFIIYKFRTMVVDAERHTGPVWAKAGDPRLTSIGRWLRKWKVDELPQLINVLRGEMSLVGPRPEREFFVSLFTERVPGYHHRMKVRPGISGPAQLRNGYDTGGEDVIRKLRYDIYYLRKQCLLLDLTMILDTFAYILREVR